MVNGRCSNAHLASISFGLVYLLVYWKKKWLIFSRCKSSTPEDDGSTSKSLWFGVLGLEFNTWYQKKKQKESKQTVFSSLFGMFPLNIGIPSRFQKFLLPFNGTEIGNLGRSWGRRLLSLSLDGRYINDKSFAFFCSFIGNKLYLNQINNSLLLVDTLTEMMGGKEIQFRSFLEAYLIYRSKCIVFFLAWTQVSSCEFPYSIIY